MEPCAGKSLQHARKLRIDSGGRAIPITLDQVIPPIDPPADTRYVKHVRIQSELLTKFWGRPMYLGAHVLLPAGFEEHPGARYPLMVFHGHFPTTSGFRRRLRPIRTSSPITASASIWKATTELSRSTPTSSTGTGSGPTFLRVLAIEIQHANPFYDDSYAVNSANLGPYGDAINQELIPYIEKKFRGIGQAGRASRTAVRPADGRRSPRRSSIRICTTDAGLPAPTRLISGPTRWSTSTRTGTLTTWATSGNAPRGRVSATTSDMCPPRWNR